MHIYHVSDRKISTTESVFRMKNMYFFSVGLDVLLEDDYAIHCLI